MKHNEFSIGVEFVTDTGQWRCTDVGTRTITAIKICEVHVAHQADDSQITTETVSTDLSWFNGPPYAVAEHAFDEHDIASCRTA